MSEKANSQPDEQEMVQHLATAFEQLADAQGSALTGVREMQVTGQTLLQREEKRLARKLGANHPRVQRLSARRADMLRTLRDLEAEAETAKLRVPEVSPTEVLVYGRVLDERQRGIGGLNVYAADANGQKVAAAWQATTDASGYYAFKIDSATMPGKPIANLTLAVNTPADRLVHRESQPLNMSAGSLNVAEVRLNRNTLTGAPTRPQPEPAKGSDSDTADTEAEAFVVSGTVTDTRGRPLQGLMVSVFDKDRKYDDKLGSDLTDAKGQYEVAYIKQDFREGPEPGADLYLTVINADGALLYSSEEMIRYDASRHEVIDIQIKAGGPGR